MNALEVRKSKIVKLLALFTLAFAILFAVSMTAKADEVAQVTGVVQKDASSSSIKISWDAMIGVKYAVAMSLDGTNYEVVETTSNTQYTKYSLSAGKTYWIKVCAYKGGNYDFPDKSINGAYSTPIQVVTATDNISGLKMTKSTIDSITVSWTKATGASYYEVSYKQKGSNSYTVVAKPTKNSYAIKKLKADTNYEIRVTPVRKSNAGYEAKDKYQFLYNWAAYTMIKGNKIKNLGLKAWEGNTKTPAVKWETTCSNKPTGYQVQVCDEKKKVIKTYTAKGGSIDYCKISNSKLKNKVFQFRVRSYEVINNKNSYGTWSSYKVVAPTCKVTITGKSSTTAKLSWNKVPGATNYTIYYTTSSGGKFKKLATLKGTSYTWKNRKAYQNYYVYVKANKIKFGSKKYTSTTAAEQKIYYFWLGGTGRSYNYTTTRYNK